MKRSFVLVVVVALAAGCGDSPSGSIDGPAGTADAPGADAAGGVDATPGSCPAGTLCLEVHPVVPGAIIPDGRLTVVFYQFLDNVTPYPPNQVTYDVAFAGASTMIEIPLAAVTLPVPIDDYRLCPRTCFNLADPACDCPAADVKVALAVAMVLGDTDGSGAIEPAEVTRENRYGAGFLGLGAADAAYPPPTVLDPLFLDGILDGLAVYGVDTSGDFDALIIPAPGTVFGLDVCVPGDPSCDQVRIPNLN